jgi:hypothetical protein
VVASIHQPSTSTFNLFDKLLLLSYGKPHYFGPVSAVTSHFESLGHKVPLHVNPAEFLLELVNVDFASHRKSALERLDEIQRAWGPSACAEQLSAAIADAEKRASSGAGAGAGADGGVFALAEAAEKKPSMPSLILTLLHRSFIKSYRDVVVYGIRLAMYLGRCQRSPATTEIGFL